MKKISPCLNIAFSFDKNYYRQAIIAMLSLLIASESADIQYSIYCLVKNDISSKEKDEIYNCLSSFKALERILYVDVSGYFKDAYECRGISSATYYKLMLHRLLPEIEKIVYSDVDVIFVKDLSELLKIDLDEYYIAAVTDVGLNQVSIREKYSDLSYWKTYLSDIGNNYKNGGFLYFNLKKIREANFDELIMKLSKQEMIFQDQDLLNILFCNCQDRVFTLSSKFNVMSGSNSGVVIKENIISREFYNDVLYSPVMIHYAGGKPWEILGCENYEVWWNFVDKFTPYFSYFKYRLIKRWLKRSKQRVDCCYDKSSEKIVNYLKDRGITSCKIYCAGAIGESITSFLRKASIKVDCIFDAKAKKSPYFFYSTKVVPYSKKLINNYDTVIVASVAAGNEIKKILLSSNKNINIISFLDYAEFIESKL